MTPTHRASPPTAPPPLPSDAAAAAALVTRRRTQESLERSRQVRGLIALALIVLLFSLTRTGWGRVFTHNWLRLWSSP